MKTVTLKNLLESANIALGNLTPEFLGALAEAGVEDLSETGLLRVRRAAKDAGLSEFAANDACLIARDVEKFGYHNFVATIHGVICEIRVTADTIQAMPMREGPNYGEAF